MKIFPPLMRGYFLRRYKRFFADVRAEDGSVLTLHCPNTGSMLNCVETERPCWYSLSRDPRRKLPGTLEIVTTRNGNLAGINTARANHLVKEAIVEQRIEQLRGYRTIRGEVRYGEENSRIDFLLENEKQRCFIEVKNVTLEQGDGTTALFPDAVTARGTRHLRELARIAAAGQRAVLFFCVQLTGVERVSIARNIDQSYARGLLDAMQAGVQVIAWQADLAADEICLRRPLPFTPQ